MIKIPDEVVEAAARGLARYNCEQWDSDPERFWPHFADQARAAIALIRAETLEEAARVADDERWNTACLTSLPPQSSAAFNIAAAIRALKEAPCTSS